MSQYFEHTPQGIGVANQVENLAQEVDEAFTKIEDVVYQDKTINSSFTSSIGNLDNKYIRDYATFNKGVTSNYQLYTQDLYFPRNSKEASLDLMPHTSTTAHTNAIVVSNKTVPAATYLYKSNGVLTDPGDFTIVGKKVVFYTSPESGHTLQISYRGYNTTSPDDVSGWPFELKYNILQVPDLSIPVTGVRREFEYTQSGNMYTVSGYNFRSLCSTFVQSVITSNPTNLDKYIAVYDGVGNRIEDLSNITITTSMFRFSTPTNITSPTLKLYVANSSLGQLVECIYRLFYNHDHDTNGGNNVNHSSLVGLFDNETSATIKYKVSSKKGYDHPQYINREGYVADKNVYNNAMLGDFLLGSTVESNGDFSNNNENSVKLVFGSYSSGHKVFYNKDADSLYIDTVNKHGIKVSSQLNKKALSVNDHSLADTTLNGATNKALKISLLANDDTELGILKLTRKLIDGSGNEIEDDQSKLIAAESEYNFSIIKNTLTIADGAKISFGDPSIFDIVREGNNVHFKSVHPSITSKMYLDTEVNVDALKVRHLDADNLHLTSTQKIVYNTNAHDSTTYDYINYDNNQLNIKATNAVNIKNNGRQKGITLDNKHNIYAASNVGDTVDDSTPTNLFLETSGDTYLIKSGYTWTVDSRLNELPKADLYANIIKPNNIEITFLDNNLTNGITLGNINNRIFGQRDSTGLMTTMLKADNGVDIISNYSRTVGSDTGSLVHGTVRARTFKTPDNLTAADTGFFGNVTIPTNNTLVVNGSTTFNKPVQFSVPVEFQQNSNFNTLSGNLINVQGLNVANSLSVANLSVTNTVNTETLSVKNITHNTNGTAVFGGTIQFTSTVKPTFVSGATLQGTSSAVTLDAETVNVEDLNVLGTADFNELVVDNLEVNTELRFSTMLQTNNAANSLFEGTVEFGNNVRMPKSWTKFILGAIDIEDKRTTAGLMLKNDEVRLGVGGIISAGKILAGKGRPDGSIDRTGGYGFASSTGLPDGDTGMFAEGEVDSQSGSDIVFRIDGTEVGRLTKGTGSPLAPIPPKGLVTQDQLIEQQGTLEAGLLDKIYKNGTIYMNGSDTRNPASVLNWPTSVWSQYAAGRSVMGYGSPEGGLHPMAGMQFQIIGNKMGDYSHQLTIDEMPSHNHLRGIERTGAGRIEGYLNAAPQNDNFETSSTDFTGGNKPHSILNPVIITMMWMRTS